MIEGLASESIEQKTVMIDATYLKAHRTASSLQAKKGGRRPTRAPDRPYEGWLEHQAASRRRRNRIEIMFGRLKDWRWVATRYDRCAKIFLSAVALAVTVIFCLWRSMSLEITQAQVREIAFGTNVHPKTYGT